MPVLAVADRALVPQGVTQVDPETDAVIDALMSRDRGRPVVLATRDPRAAAAARAARLVCSDGDVGLLPLDVPPTVFFLALAAVAELPEDQLTLAARTADLAVAATTTHVLLSSVASLERPRPSFADHVLSLWPTTRFLVDRTAGSVRRTKTPVVPADDATVVALSSGVPWPDADPQGWPCDAICLSLPQDRDVLPWRARRWLETTRVDRMLGDVLRDVADEAASGALPTCRSCERPGGPGACVMCRLPLASDAPVAPRTPSPTPGGPA